jgi:hypothetical protein
MQQNEIRSATGLDITNAIAVDLRVPDGKVGRPIELVGCLWPLTKRFDDEPGGNDGDQRAQYN